MVMECVCGDGMCFMVMEYVCDYGVCLWWWSVSVVMECVCGDGVCSRSGIVSLRF